MCDLDGAKQSLESLLDEVRDLKTERERYEGAINWAMGCYGNFRERRDPEGPYYWRTELAKRAKLKYNFKMCRYEALAGKERG